MVVTSLTIYNSDCKRFKIQQVLNFRHFWKICFTVSNNTKACASDIHGFFGSDSDFIWRITAKQVDGFCAGRVCNGTAFKDTNELIIHDIRSLVTPVTVFD